MNIAEEIEIMCKQTNSSNIYYQTSAHIPKIDQAGQENFSKMKVDNILEVWLMHPDSLPKFKQIVEDSGKNVVEFDLAQYLNFPRPELYARSFMMPNTLRYRQSCQP
jgi:hypothetical protein